jgi:hypothetical protein
MTGDRPAGGDAPGGSSGVDSPPPPERADVTGTGTGLGWGAGDFSLPPFGASGPSGDANSGHQGPPLPEPPEEPEPPPPPQPSLVSHKPYVGPDAGFGDGALVGGAAEGGGKPETGHGGGHRPRWAADRPSLDPPPAKRATRRVTDAASQGEQRHRRRTP